MGGAQNSSLPSYSVPQKREGWLRMRIIVSKQERTQNQKGLLFHCSTCQWYTVLTVVECPYFYWCGTKNSTELSKATFESLLELGLNSGCKFWASVLPLLPPLSSCNFRVCGSGGQVVLSISRWWKSSAVILYHEHQTFSENIKQCQTWLQRKSRVFGTLPTACWSGIFSLALLVGQLWGRAVKT